MSRAKPLPSVKLPCSYCGLLVQKKASVLRKSRSGRVYCSRSCSAKQQNVLSPKRQVEGECVDCSIPIKAFWKRCISCRSEKRYSIANKTIEQVVNSTSQRSNYRSSIREHSRRYAKDVAKSNWACQVCGYSTIVEVAHIKPF